MRKMQDGGKLKFYILRIHETHQKPQYSTFHSKNIIKEIIPCYCSFSLHKAIQDLNMRTS